MGYNLGGDMRSYLTAVFVATVCVVLCLDSYVYATPAPRCCNSGGNEGCCGCVKWFPFDVDGPYLQVPDDNRYNACAGGWVMGQTCTTTTVQCVNGQQRCYTNRVGAAGCSSTCVNYWGMNGVSFATDTCDGPDLCT